MEITLLPPPGFCVFRGKFCRRIDTWTDVFLPLGGRDKLEGSLVGLTDSNDLSLQLNYSLWSQKVLSMKHQNVHIVILIYEQKYINKA